jgi:hypothetical protein
MEPVAQLKPNFDGIVIGWSSSKMVSGSCALPPRWPPQCSCVVIESSFDPGERLQAPGSLWFHLFARKPNLEKKFIYSNKFFHNFHLSESSYTYPGLQASGLAQRLKPK